MQNIFSLFLLRRGRSKREDLAHIHARMHSHHLRERDHVKEDQMDLRCRLLNELADSAQRVLRSRGEICIDTEQDTLIHGSHRLFVGLITFFWLRRTLYSL